LLGGSAFVLIAALTACSRIQTSCWQNSESLWEHTLASTSDNNARAQSNLGIFLFEEGRVDEAVAHCQKALEIWPYDAPANNCLGIVASRKSALNESIYYFQRAVQSNPNFAPAENNLGKALFKIDRVDDAIIHFQKAVTANPDMPDAHYNLGVALVQKGQTVQAMTHYERAIQLNPGLAGAYNNLGSIYLQQRHAASAIYNFQGAVELKPDDFGFKNNLAWVLATWPEATVRDGSRALDLAIDANRRSGGQDPVVIRTLAAAFAEVGKFSEAIDTAFQGLRYAEAQTNIVYVNALQKDLRLYHSGQPLRDPPRLP
jgi:tetratricopeptide (TPR) repeat protein